MSRGFPSLELDTVLEERSDPEQTQVRTWVNITSHFTSPSCLLLIAAFLFFLFPPSPPQIDLITPESPLQPSGDEMDDFESDS